MKEISSVGRSTSGMKLPHGAYSVVLGILVWLLVGSGSSAGAVGSHLSLGQPGSAAHTAPNTPICPGGQCFQDVPSTNPFYSYINNLYLDSIINGYPCGATPAGPCVPPDNRPYYVTGSSVSRQAMAKFVDNGRRNIAEATGLSLDLSNKLSVSGTTTITGATTISSAGTALTVSGNSLITGDVTIGDSLVISGTAYNTLRSRTNSGGSAIVGECVTPNTACYAVAGGAPAGDFGGFFVGGRGVYAGSSDSQRPALDTVATGTTAYGVNAYSVQFRGLDAGRNDPSFLSMYVDKLAGESTNDPIAEVAASMEVDGNLMVVGSKGGYVVDAMQNVDSSALEPGDVVVIVGSTTPVLGQIPVITVRKATTAYDTHLAGVVDQALYVPDAATRAAYAKQQEAQRVAQAARAQVEQAAAAEGRKPDLSGITMPEANTTDAQGTVHATDAAQVLPGDYTNVVTLGSFKMIKVDASFGPIHAGDLLTTSEHAGYAMKVTDKVSAIGAVVGKALSDLDSGTGVIPVMVTLK